MGTRPTYSEEEKEQAFVVWLYEADRDPGRTERILAEDAATFATDGSASARPTPDKRTILRWSVEHDWHRKAQEALARHAPAWKARQEGRLRLIQDRAISEHDAVLRGERDHLPAAALNARVRLIQVGYEATGLGAYGTKTPAPEIAPPHDDAQLEGGIDEVARSFHRRMLASGGGG
jgi:hypothetical protein